MTVSRPVTAWIAFVLSIAFAASPLLVPGFGGFDPNRFPVPQNDPPVQPAGYAFAIWSLIYLWLIAGMGWGVWKARDDAEWHAMRLPLSVSLLVGSFWLAVAVASPVWATVLIWVMLIAALVALFRAPTDDGWFAALPVGLYAGWLSAASCVSVGLLAAGFGLTTEDTAALVMLGIAIVLAAAVQSALQRTPSYGLGVIWALAAVAVRNTASFPSVAAVAAGGALALVLPTYRAWRNTA